MKKIEPKSKIVEKIADRYNLKHGDMVEVEWLREMANKEKIDMHDFRSIFGVPNRKNNDENVYQYRENAYQIIVYKLNIPIEHLENVINEIGELMLEYKLAKLCRDGRIINMAEAY